MARKDLPKLTVFYPVFKKDVQWEDIYGNGMSVSPKTKGVGAIVQFECEQRAPILAPLSGYVESIRPSKNKGNDGKSDAFEVMILTKLQNGDLLYNVLDPVFDVDVAEKDYVKAGTRIGRVIDGYTPADYDLKWWAYYNDVTDTDDDPKEGIQVNPDDFAKRYLGGVYWPDQGEVKPTKIVTREERVRRTPKPGNGGLAILAIGALLVFSRKGKG